MSGERESGTTPLKPWGGPRCPSCNKPMLPDPDNRSLTACADARCRMLHPENAYRPAQPPAGVGSST